MYVFYAISSGIRRTAIARAGRSYSPYDAVNELYRFNTDGRRLVVFQLEGVCE